jgi:CrcB protein
VGPDFWWIAGGVALLGGAGSVLRFALSKWNNSLPWGILTANTLASAVVGFCLETSSGVLPVIVATVFATGFAGGLSTFSTWAGQTAQFFLDKKFWKAALNVLLNMVLPFSGLMAGLILGHVLLK